MASLRIPLSRQTVAQALAGLSPVMLVPLVGSLSRSVNTGVVRSRSWAAALQAAGAQRLSGLQSAAGPRVRATLNALMARLPNLHLNLDEINIVRAVIELYLRLILQLIEAGRCPRRRRLTARHLCIVPHLLFVSPSRAHRTRIGVFLPASTFAP